MWTLFLLSAFCTFQNGFGITLRNGDVAYVTNKISGDKTNVDATDGQYIWKATVSEELDDMVFCHLYHYPGKASTILDSDKVVVENIGLRNIKKMKQKCRRYHDNARRATGADDHDTFNADLAKTMPFAGDFKTGAPSGAGSHFAIFPGTKWCGFQNVANNMQDLGIHNQTDACCRTHDHCPYYIDRFETKYHYFNHYPWTLSHCDCDQHLYDCLKRVNTPTSNTVGKLFFGVLDVQCFKFQQGEYCESTSILSNLWCTKKNKGAMAIMENFPYKWGDESDVSSKTAGSHDLVG